MTIRVHPGDKKRFVWSNQDALSFVLSLSDSRTQAGNARETGVYDGEKRVLADFFLAAQEGADLFLNNANHVDLLPEGARIAFPLREDSFAETQETGPTLSVAALIHECALSFSLAGAGAGFGIGLAFPPSGPIMCWKRCEESGITVYRDVRGVALASIIPFDLEEEGEATVRCIPRPRGAAGVAGGEDVADGSSGNFTLYCAFAGDDSAALASRLAATCAVEAHCARVAEFIAENPFTFGDTVLDEALAWARVTAWMRLAASRARGGAAWSEFRDRVLSLVWYSLPCGFLSESRAELRALASLLDRDPASPSYGNFLDARESAEVGAVYPTGADAASLFIIAAWEFFERTGDRAFLDEVRGAIELSVDAALERRCDAHGFLLHGSVDAPGSSPLAPRGDRAVEVEALWYHALFLASRIAHLLGDTPRGDRLGSAADALRHAFKKYFWSDEDRVLADRLPPGIQGEELADFRVRPAQLAAVAIPGLFAGPDADIPDADIPSVIFDVVSRELATPFGLCSLSPDDPHFHPFYEKDGWYGPASSLHNGPIDVRLMPVYLASLRRLVSEQDPRSGSALFCNTARLFFSSPFPGSLTRYLDAAPCDTGEPAMRGSDADIPATAGFIEAAFRDIIGFSPRLSENRLTLAPNLPQGLDRAEGSLPFGPGWMLDIKLERFRSGPGTGERSGYRAEVLWKVGAAAPALTVPPPLTVNGILLAPGVKTVFEIADFTEKSDEQLFPARDFSPPWCGAAHLPGYLENLAARHPLDRLPGEDFFTASLAWFFDSDRFFRSNSASLFLGVLWEREQTAFRLWAPTARSVTLNLYESGSFAPGETALRVPMKRLPDGVESGGVWEAILYGDLHGTYYTYTVRVHGSFRETADPYARACGLNGIRSLVADFSRTDPEGWDTVESPPVKSANDVVAYELHVADLTSSPAWNGPERLRRTFLGAAARGTTRRGFPTGFDHVASLGITHVQLMPVFDFSSVDESKTLDGEYRARFSKGLFNWGYDPGNYSAPEGSYSTDPSDGALRVRELKTLIASFARAGIGVVMDVVYNHVPSSKDHPLALTVPGYYFRLERFSGAGDDTASERPMFRSWMIRSLAWWLAEYKLSGFRFDLMGLHDVRTMNEAAARLREIRPDVLLYGEGWDMYRGRNRGHEMVSASMLEARKLPGIGFFNDAFRCALKGSAFSAGEAGFVHDGSRRESVKFGLVGAVFHPEVHNRAVVGTANPNPWTELTASSVNYTEIHDNMTLYDKLVFVEPERDEAHYERLQRLALSLVLLAQGMPVLHAGMEFMRTKEIPRAVIADAESGRIPFPGDLHRVPSGGITGAYRAFSHNSYDLSDRVNALDWDRCAEKHDLVEYVRGLIALRKAHPLFRLRTASEVALSLSFIGETAPDSGKPSPPVLAWIIAACATVDSWKSALIVCNVTSVPASFTLPPPPSDGRWHLIADGKRVLSDEASELADGESGPGCATEVTIAAKALYVYAEF